MTNGFLFDLYALAFAAYAAGVVYLLMAWFQREKQPVDWERDYPEFRCPKSHVRIME